VIYFLKSFKVGTRSESCNSFLAKYFNLVYRLDDINANTLALINRSTVTMKKGCLDWERTTFDTLHPEMTRVDSEKMIFSGILKFYVVKL